MRRELPCRYHRRHVAGRIPLSVSSALSRKLQQAEQRLRRGDADGARALAEQVLERAPRNPDAWFLLAMAQLAQGATREAAAGFERVLAAEPRHGAALEHLGLACLMSGRYEEAGRALERAAAIPGAPASVHMRLGIALLEQGQAGGALAALTRAAAIDARDVDVQLNLGRALAASGDAAAAARAFEQAYALAPDRAEAPFNLGVLALDNGAPQRAQHWLERAVAIEPRNAEALSELARALALQGRLEAARERWLAAAGLASDRPDTHEGLAACDMALGRYGEAIEHLRAALRLDPARAEAGARLALALFEVGELDAAAEASKRAIATAPSAAAYSAATNVHLVRGQLEAAIELLEEGYRRTGDTTLLGTLAYQLRQACDWDRWRAVWASVEPLLATSDALGSPFWLLCEPTTPQQQLAYTQRWAGSRFRDIAPLASPSRPLAPEGRRLRVGYLSSDLQDHAVACLIADVFDHHDRDRFEIYAYSHGPDDGSAMRQRLRAAIEHFVDIGREPDDVAAARIGADALDVLVDLKGYTLGDRLTIMARRPCPIQVTWLGYPGTTGADFIDYLIADPILVPAEAEAHYSERIVRMPHSYQPTDRRRPIRPSEPRAAYSLPDDAFVFCCFNQTNKIGPDIFAAWMRVLQRVPGSVLWLLDGYPLATANLRQAARAHGIDTARLVFGPKLPNAAHLARYRVADLSLDTFPYTSHTTLSDALWLGCPGIALCGDTFAARVSTSLLHAAGLAELATYRLSDYEALAVALAQAPSRLAEVRARVRAAQEAAPLFDSQRFARDLESLLVALVQRARAPG